MHARRGSLVVSSIVCTVTALTVPVGAAPGFVSEPTTLTTHQSAGQYAVVSAPDGTAHATWVEETGSNFLLMSSSRPRGGTWTAPLQVDTGSSTQDAEPSLAVDGQGRVVAAWRDFLPGRTGSVIRTASLAGGSWSPSQDLSPATTHAFMPAVATDARGDAAIVWTEDVGVQRIVRAAYRAAGGTWASSDVTTVPGGAAATVAVDRDGRAVALWTQTGRVHTADRDPANGTWSAPRLLSAGNGIELEMVADAQGELTAAWSNGSTIETSTRAPGASWGPTETLGSTTGLAWQLDLGIGYSGEALAAWVASTEGNRRSDLHTATRTPEGTWATTQVDSPQVYNSSPTVGFGTGGASVVLWTGGTEQLTTTRTLYAVTRTPGRAWTAPTALSSSSVTGPLAAVDPDGHGTLLWTEMGGTLRTQVFDGVAPVIDDFEPTVFARSGKPALYVASAIDLWSPPSVSWQFDDRPPVAGERVSRTFPKSGLHHVRFVATDAASNTATRRSTTIVASKRPRLSDVVLSRRVIDTTRSGAGSRSRLSFRLDAPALVRVRLVRRSGKVVATVDRALEQGKRGLSLSAQRLDAGRGRYTVRVSARNAFGRDVSSTMPLRIIR